MKVLVVDDDVVSQMAMIEVVKGMNRFEVVDAADGEAAWTALSEGLLPAMICCDVRMPKLSGIELLQRVKGDPVLASTPFVMVSSASDRTTVEAAIQLGISGYILKPFDFREARNQLERIFSQHAGKLIEAPSATVSRLNIAPQRLKASLTMLQTKLPGDLEELRRLLTVGDTATLLTRIDSLYTGCITLGLWQVGTMIDQLRQREVSSATIDRMVAEVGSAVASQLKSAKEIFGAR